MAKRIKNRTKHEEDPMELAVEKSGEIFRRMTPNEKTLVKMMIPVIEQTAFPLDFFEKRTVDELNEWFGGHDDVMLTENVRAYLHYYNILDKYLNELQKLYDSLDEE